LPNARHLVVAHSHGGNVALLAMRQGPLSPPRVDGLVTLASPFLRFEQFNGSDREEALRVYPALLVIGFVSLSLFGAFNQAPMDSHWVLLNLARTALIAPVGVLSLSGFSGFLRRRLRLLRLPTAESGEVPLLILRAAGDEASLVLGIAQLTSYVGDRLWRMFAAPALKLGGSSRSAVMTSGLLYFGGLLALISSNVSESLPGSVVVVPELFALSLAGLQLASALFFVPAAFLIAVSVGPDLLLHSVVNQLTVEPAPAGWEGRFVNIEVSPADEKRIGLRHAIHSLPGTAERVASWIREIGSPGVI
jgi:hypothetical protein